MKHLSPSDPVPTLRGDLVFTPRPTGSGAEVIHIRPVGSGDGTQLHGFELSLARMLDGRRTAQDLVNRAGRIGLPLTLPALEGFIDFMRARALISRSQGEVSASLSPWAERMEWDPLVRTQYQTVLKSMRAGNEDEARVRLDQLLATAPLLDEARSLRGWMQQHPGATVEGESFNSTYLKAQRAWLQRHTAVARLPSTETDALDQSELKAVRPSFTPYALLAAVVVVGLIGLFTPFPAVVSVPAQVSALSSDPVYAPAAGTLDAVTVSEGDDVKAGDPLVAYAQPKGTSVTARVAGTVRELSAAEGQPVLEGQELMQIEDIRQLRALAHLDLRQARDVHPGQTATISLGQRRAKATVSAIAGREVVTTIDNSTEELEPGHAVVDIDVGPKSLFQRIH